MKGSSVDIAIPVLNEERAIDNSLRTLSSYLSSWSPYDWCITVVDNGSKDQTWSIAQAFADSSPCTRLIRLDRPGRGGALKAAWSTSTADVVAYMDVDLSTGLEALEPLLAPLIEGTAEISIGSRLARGAVIERSPQREIISRIYNVIARRALGYEIRDAQCGFKAVRASVARDLIPRIEDDSWFFDTELLVHAWRDGLRINEVPVRWIEDDDSRVHIMKTAFDDLRGIWRLAHPRPKTTHKPRSPSKADLESMTSTSNEEERPVDFDSYADKYVEAVDQSVSFTGRNSAFYAKRKVEVLESIVCPRVGTLQGLSVLDVGCGTGTTDRYLQSRVGHLEGVDVSDEMLSIARTAVPKAKYHWYDGEKLPFSDDSFDVVVAICVLHHVPMSQRYKFVSEMVRVTRSEGVVAVFEHNPLNPLTRRAVNTCEIDRDAVLLSPRETMALLREAANADPEISYYLFSPLGGVFGRAFDRGLRGLPLGGQYAGWVQCPPGNSH